MSLDDDSLVIGGVNSDMRQLSLFTRQTPTETPPVTETHTRSGWIYILSNAAMPGLLKIGCSVNGGKSRAELFYKNDTAVPERFALEYERHTKDRYWDERRIHLELSKYRRNRSREFFSCNLELAIRACDFQICSEKPDLNHLAEINQKRRRAHSYTEQEKREMGDRLRSAVMNSPLTVSAIADACDISRRMLYRYMWGESAPKQTRLSRIVSVLNITEGYILRGDE